MKNFTVIGVIGDPPSFRHAEIVGIFRTSGGDVWGKTRCSNFQDLNAFWHFRVNIYIYIYIYIKIYIYI